MHLSNYTMSSPSSHHLGTLGICVAIAKITLHTSGYFVYNWFRNISVFSLHCLQMVDSSDSIIKLVWVGLDNTAGLLSLLVMRYKSDKEAVCVRGCTSMTRSMSDTLMTSTSTTENVWCTNHLHHQTPYISELLGGEILPPKFSVSPI